MPERSVSANLLLGSSVHAALAEYHLNLQRGETTEAGNLHRTITESWAEREEQVTVNYKDGETKDDGIAKAVTLIEMYLKEPPPQNIIGVEQELFARVPNSQGDILPTPLMAVLDLVTKADEEITVHEFKTSGRTYSEFETESSLQPTCYAAAIQESSGQVPHVEYIVLVKTKTPKVHRLQTIRTQDDIGRLGDIIETVEKAIDRDIFYPIENPIHCSGCPYRRPCREWGRSFTTTPAESEGSH